MNGSRIPEIKHENDRDKLSWRMLAWRKLEFYWYIQAVYFKIYPDLKKNMTKMEREV